MFFRGTLDFRRGIDATVPLLIGILYQLILPFSKIFLFFPASTTHPSQGKDDDLLVYTVTSVTSSPEAPPLVKPPILQVYSR